VWNFIRTNLRVAWGALGTAWGALGTTLTLITSLLSLEFKDQVPPEYGVFLPFVVFFALAIIFWVTGSIFDLWKKQRDAEDPIGMPGGEVAEYTARPYEVGGDDLSELSKFAQQAFHGDTMAAEIVQYAVGAKCALGMRLTNSEGKNIGFFDVFHLRSAALKQWLKGTLPEPDLKKHHFERIPKPSKDGILELIIGAIYLAPEYRTSEPSLAVTFAECCQRYLWQRCAGFGGIILYASIFSKPGEKFARIYGFERHKIKAEREGHGKEHDVYCRELRPDDPIEVRHGLGGARNVIVRVKSR
jgi:hypothetical protein